MLHIRNIWMIKLFTNREQIRPLNSKSTDLDWNYSIPYWKLKLLICDLLFTTFVKNPPSGMEQWNSMNQTQGIARNHEAHSFVISAVSSLQKGGECSDRGDSSALSGQTLLCSGIIFALKSRGVFTKVINS